MSMKKYYPTAFALYMTYFVLGVASSIMSHYKQELAALWGSSLLADGTYDVSGVLAVIAALGLGRLITYPFAGPISDRFGRRVPALIGCACYLVFFGAVCFTHNYVVAYILGIVAGAANGFLDVSITPSCMEIFKEKGTIANIFTKLSISIAQFLLPFAIGFVAAEALPFSTIFIFCAVLIAVVGVALIFLPFPPYERAVKVKGEKKERMKFTPSAIILIILGFTTSTTFMIWLNCYQELAISYGIADPSRVQSLYSIGIVLALFVNAALLAKGLKPSKILVIYPSVSVVTLVAVLLPDGLLRRRRRAAARDQRRGRDVPQKPRRHDQHSHDILLHRQLRRTEHRRPADQHRRSQRPEAHHAVQHRRDSHRHRPGRHTQREIRQGFSERYHNRLREK